MLQKDSEIAKAYEVLEVLSRDEETMRLYELREKALHDEASLVADAKDLGREEGRAVEKMNTIRNLLVAGMSDQFIYQITRCTQEQLQEAKKK